MQSDLEAKLAQARDLNENKAHQDLRTQLLRQEKVTTEVRQEATGFLNQMKVLSERSGQSLEREEKLVHQVHQLEKELQQWKNRYARSKTQLGNLRSSSIESTLSQPSAARDAAFTSQEGLVKDIHITKFQMAIDELLQSARGSEPNAVLAQVKSVVVAVRNITLDMGDTQRESLRMTTNTLQLRTLQLITMASLTQGPVPRMAPSTALQALLDLLKFLMAQSSPQYLFKTACLLAPNTFLLQSL